jgi:hypothetical protein
VSSPDPKAIVPASPLKEKITLPNSIPKVGEVYVFEFVEPNPRPYI